MPFPVSSLRSAATARPVPAAAPQAAPAWSLRCLLSRPRPSSLVSAAHNRFAQRPDLSPWGVLPPACGCCAPHPPTIPAPLPTMSTIILRSALKCPGPYSAQPLRLPRRSSWFIWLSLLTCATMDATCPPNLACAQQRTSTQPRAAPTHAGECVALSTAGHPHDPHGCSVSAVAVPAQPAGSPATLSHPSRHAACCRRCACCCAPAALCCVRRGGLLAAGASQLRPSGQAQRRRAAHLDGRQLHRRVVNHVVQQRRHDGQRVPACALATTAPACPLSACPAGLATLRRMPIPASTTTRRRRTVRTLLRGAGCAPR